jgi:beta-galactosidase
MLQTSGEAANIKLSADRKSVLANGQDLSFVSIQLTDSNGIPQPNSTNRLHFKIEGPGVIAGVGNGDIKDVDPYIADTRKAWHGQALVVVRSTNKQGNIKLTVSSPGIPDAVLHLRATKSVTAVNE